MNKTRQNFLYPNIPPQTRVFGNTHVIGNVINESGDWRKCLPPEEYQYVNGIESSACYIYAQTHAVATILEKQFNLPDKDFAERFNALLSDGTQGGGDPLKGAESFQNDGLIAYESMPFSIDIESWYDFHSWKGADENTCREEGRTFLKKWKLNYDIVWEMNDLLETKYAKLREALKKSPVPMSVYGETDETGNYISKPQGKNDTHMVEAVFVDENNVIWVFDTYAPCLKPLPANYPSDFGMLWGITQVVNNSSSTIIKLTIWQRLLKWLQKQLNLISYFDDSK